MLALLAVSRLPMELCSAYESTTLCSRACIRVAAYLVVPLQEGVLIHAHVAVLHGQLLHQLLCFAHLRCAGLREGLAHKILVDLWGADVIREAQVQHVHARRRKLRRACKPHVAAIYRMLGISA